MAGYCCSSSAESWEAPTVASQIQWLVKHCYPYYVNTPPYYTTFTMTRVFAICQITLGWIGLENILLRSINITRYMKPKERHHNPRPQLNPRKFRKKWLEETNIVWKPTNATTQRTKIQKNKVRFWPLLANSSWVALALGCEVRWFH